MTACGFADYCGRPSVVTLEPDAGDDTSPVPVCSLGQHVGAVIRRMLDAGAATVTVHKGG